METTRTIPGEVLPYWKSLEGLSNDNKVILIALLSNSLSGKKQKEDELKYDKEVRKYTDYMKMNARKLYISPKVKAVETGNDWGKGLSWDYKKEIGEARAAKYL